MSARDPREEGAAPVGDGSSDGSLRRVENLLIAEDADAWRARTRVFLTPVAAPSIMGLFGFMVATSLAQSMGLFTVLSTLTAGSALTAAGFWAGGLGVVRAGGWLFVVSAAAAWLTAGAMTLEHAYGRMIIPMGKWSKAGNIPGRMPTRPLSYPAGMPGVRVGQ